MQVIINGVIWFKVTDKAREIYKGGLFDLYAILNNKEKLIVNDTQIEILLLSEKDIYIKIGNHVDVFKLMYDFMGLHDKSLRKVYKNIPDKNFNYEQFIVAQFSNLIDQ
jgi:hypothetical protein